MSTVPTPMFTLVKTPGVYNLPTGQPACLEAFLYLKHLQTSQHSINFNPKVEMLSVTTTTMIPQQKEPSNDENEEEQGENAPEMVEKITTETKAPISFVDNKYWLNGMDTQHRFDTTSLPILHHHNAIVPAHNIIPYLKSNLFDVDSYMSPTETTTIDALRQLTHKLQTILQYILISLNSYPIASETFWGVRWNVKSKYKDIVTRGANHLGIYTYDDATMEVSYLLTSFAARLGDATWFGPQNKISSLDFAVASCVAFCLGADSDFLNELLYRFYPTLVNHCHNLLTQVLGSDDKLITDVDRYTAPIRKLALIGLIGEKPTTPLEQTPRKKASSSRRRSAPSRNTIQDEIEDEIEDDGMAAEDKITALDEEGDNGNDNSQQQTRVDDQDKLLQPSEELLYLSRHAIGPQDATIVENNPSQRIRQYSVQAWLGTTKWLEELETPATTWANQFLMIGAIGLISYFIIAKAKGESDREYRKALDDIAREEGSGSVDDVNRRVFDFHRVDTPLVNRYKQ